MKRRDVAIVLAVRRRRGAEARRCRQRARTRTRRGRAIGRDVAQARAAPSTTPGAQIASAQTALARSARASASGTTRPNGRRASSTTDTNEALPRKPQASRAPTRRVAATAASLAALDTCVTGAQRATFERNAGDPATAIDMLKLVQPVCASLATGAIPRPPCSRSTSATPRCCVVGKTYYAYSTNSAIGNLPVISSTDLVHWTIVGNALPCLPAGPTPGATWAPAVVALGGQATSRTTRRVTRPGSVQCISVAVADKPGGPFIDLSKDPLVCQADLGGSIDPQPFVDAQRTAVAVVEERTRRRPAGHDLEPAAARRRPRARSVRPSPLIQADQEWEDGVVEAPSLVDVHGTLALFYSGNDWNGADYALGEARLRVAGRTVLEAPRQAGVRVARQRRGPGQRDRVRITEGRSLARVQRVQRRARRLSRRAGSCTSRRVNVDGDAVTVTPR